jgi:hypothetical protein
MNIRQLLRHFDLVGSAEVKIRLANRQIKLNGEDFDQSQDFNIDLNSMAHIGDFLTDNWEILNSVAVFQLFRGNVPDMFGTDHNFNRDNPAIQKWLDFVQGFICISISKKHHFVFKLIPLTTA